MIFMKSDIICLTLNSGKCSTNQYPVGVCTIPKVSVVSFCLNLFLNIYCRILQETFFYAVLGTTKAYFKVYLLRINLTPHTFYFYFTFAVTLDKAANCN